MVAVATSRPLVLWSMTRATPQWTQSHTTCMPQQPAVADMEEALCLVQGTLPAGTWTTECPKENVSQCFSFTDTLGVCKPLQQWRVKWFTNQFYKCLRVFHFANLLFVMYYETLMKWHVLCNDDTNSTQVRRGRGRVGIFSRPAIIFSASAATCL